MCCPVFIDLPANFFYTHLGQEFMSVAGIIALPGLILLEKTDSSRRAKFTKQGLEAYGSYFIRRQVFGTHFRTSSSHFTGFSTRDGSNF